MSTFMKDKDGRYIPAIPEPYWFSRWWIFGTVPGCYQCQLKFRNREEYDQHFVLVHLERASADDEDEE